MSLVGFTSPRLTLSARLTLSSAGLSAGVLEAGVRVLEALGFSISISSELSNSFIRSSADFPAFLALGGATFCSLARVLAGAIAEPPETSLARVLCGATRDSGDLEEIEEVSEGAGDPRAGLEVDVACRGIAAGSDGRNGVRSLVEFVRDAIDDAAVLRGGL